MQRNNFYVIEIGILISVILYSSFSIFDNSEKFQESQRMIKSFDLSYPPKVLPAKGISKEKYFYTDRLDTMARYKIVDSLNNPKVYLLRKPYLSNFGKVWRYSIAIQREKDWLVLDGRIFFNLGSKLNEFEMKWVESKYPNNPFLSLKYEKLINRRQSIDGDDGYTNDISMGNSKQKMRGRAYYLLDTVNPKFVIYGFNCGFWYRESTWENFREPMEDSVNYFYGSKNELSKTLSYYYEIEYNLKQDELKIVDDNCEYKVTKDRSIKYRNDWIDKKKGQSIPKYTVSKENLPCDKYLLKGTYKFDGNNFIFVKK